MNNRELLHILMFLSSDFVFKKTSFQDEKTEAAENYQDTSISANGGANVGYSYRIFDFFKIDLRH